MIKGYKEKKTKKLLKKTKKEFEDNLDKTIKDEQKNLQKFIDSKINMEEYAKTKQQIEVNKNIFRSNLRKLIDLEQGIKSVKKTEFKIPTGSPPTINKTATEDSGLGGKDATKNSGIRSGYLIAGTKNVLENLDSLMNKKGHVNVLELR